MFLSHDPCDIDDEIFFSLKVCLDQVLLLSRWLLALVLILNDSVDLYLFGYKTDFPSLE